MPTIIANLTFLGVDLSVARVIQLVVAVAVAGIIWVCFRRGVTNLGISALLVGTFLATPYAFVYDMPTVTNAILAVVNDEERMHRLLPIPEALILAVVLILPVLMVETWRPGAIRSVPLIMLFGLIVWRIFASMKPTLRERHRSSDNCNATQIEPRRVVVAKTCRCQSLTPSLISRSARRC